jgi:hypothetical protein
MDRTRFEHWLDAYKRAWEGRDPVAASDLFTADANYFETPFEAPARGREGIEFSYEVLATSEIMGIAHWHTEYTRLTSNSTVELDGIFLVELDADGKCTGFREWWHKIG